MEPRGVMRELGSRPAGHAKGRAELLCAANSIRKNLEIRHADAGDGRGEKCGKTHILSERTGAKL